MTNGFLISIIHEGAADVITLQLSMPSWMMLDPVGKKITIKIH